MLLAVAVAFVVSVAIVVPISVPLTISVTVTITIIAAPVAVLFANLSRSVAVVFTLAKVSFPLGGPGVIAVYAAMFSFPVTVKEPLAVVTGHDPARSDVGWPGPVAFTPLIVVSDRVPVTLDPEELPAGARRPDVNHARRRWGTNSDSNRHLRECRQGK